MTPHDIEAAAMALGIRRPIYSKADRPDIWQDWSDHVALAWRQWHRDQDPRPFIRAAEILGGHRPIKRDAIPGKWPEPLQAFVELLPAILLEMTEPAGHARKRPQRGYGYDLCFG